MRLRPILIAPLVACAAFAPAAFVIGCLDDLAPATSCPPPAVVPRGDCPDSIFDQDAAAVGCLSAEDTACLRGPTAGCACQPTDCPTPAGACYPAPDCPVAVTNAAGASARCITLDSEDFGGGFGEPLPSESQCLCGCGGCMAVCDGRGPVFGVINDGVFMPTMAVPPTIALTSHMPDQGKLGIYIRWRGLTQASLDVYTGQWSADPAHYTLMPRVEYPLPVEAAEFTETVLLDQPLLPPPIDHAWSWTAAEDKPTLLLFYPGGAPSGDGGAGFDSATLVEIDCVIPFVLPAD